MRQYGVLIVDDSAFMRRAISLLFEQDPSFYIVGIARNGIEALEKIQRFRPDVITMDIEMPEMDGIAALQEIMRLFPVPVVMLSAQTHEGAVATLRALEMGAVDFFPKDLLLGEQGTEETSAEFLSRVKTAARARLHTERIEMHRDSSPAPYAPSVSASSAASASDTLSKTSRASRLDLMVIGCSTGGPSALQSILPRFPADFPVPILVAQHMPSGFTKPLAERFDLICPLTVREVEDGMPVTPGYIYIAPSGFQTEVIRHGNSDHSSQLRVSSPNLPNILYRPSIDVTLQSAAPIYRERLLSVILTGMGNDGTAGCTEVKRSGGHVLAEAESSCIVYGMPKAVAEAQLADNQVPLSDMYATILSFI